MSNGNLTPLQTGFSRVFLTEGRARGDHTPVYMGCMRAGGIDWSLGDITKIECPSDKGYDKFVERGKSKGAADRPSTSLVGRYAADLESELARLARIGCSFDLHFHIGVCTDPTLFNTFQKAIVFEEVDLTNYNTDDIGALEEGERSAVNETGDISAREFYEVLMLAFAEVAGAIVTNEVVDVVVCDAISCGECDNPSDGCEKVFAIANSVNESPGAIAELVFTQDAGTTWDDTEISSMDVGENPDDLACVGPNVVVISEDSVSLHYADKDDIWAGTEVWYEVTTGFVGEPRAIYSVSPRHTWIVGNSGYIYFTEDPTVGVTAQVASTLTGEDYRAVHAYDTENVLVVGNNNTVAITRNGGTTWADVVGPNPDEALLCCWMRGPNEWFVGCDDGTLWYTVDAGANWVQKNLPAQATIDALTDIQFSTPTVGWLSGYTTTPAGRIWRTIDGGYEWYVAPEGNTLLPANDRINGIAICPGEPNIVWGAGLNDDADDGFIVKGA